MKTVKLALAVECKDLAELCRSALKRKEAGEISCPVDSAICGVFLCPFKGRCNEITAADWEAIATDETR